MATPSTNPRPASEATDPERSAPESERVPWEPGDPPVDYVPPSPAALAALARGLRSALEEPLVDLGDFSQYANDG
jgi:hypothetical protein